MRARRDALLFFCAASVVGAILAACGRDDGGTAARATPVGSPSAPSSPVAASPSPDVEVGAFDALVARTARAFEREGDAFVARGSRPSAPFVASVTATGALSFSPSWSSDARLGLRLRPTQASDAAPLAALSSDRGHVVISRGAEGLVEEHLESTGDALEQSWRFARPPASPPVIRLETSGMRYVGETSSGHHFVDDATGLGVRYGRATWIDAAGRRSDVKVAREGDELVLRVPAEAASGPYPATLDPTLSPEQGIDQPVTTPTRLIDGVSLAAGPADTYLVAWLDRGYVQGPTSVRAARLAADGTLLGAPVTLMAGGSAVSVAWDGTRWLVTAAGASGTRLVRVAANGAVLDATPKVIPDASREVSVAYDGATFLVVTTDNQTPSTVRALRVDGATATVDPTKAVTITTTAVASAPAVACGATATGCAVLWVKNVSGYRPTVTRLSSADVVLDPAGIDLGGPVAPGGLVLASDGAQWLAGWGATAVKAARIASDGTITSVPDLDTASQERAQSATWDGTNFVVMWQRGSTSLLARRVDPLGALVGGSASVDTASNGKAAFAASGAARLLVTGHASPENGLHSRAFTSALAPLAASTLLTPGSNAQSKVLAAYNGSTYLVLWDDNRQTPGSGRYAARLDATGAPLDAVGTRLSFAPQALASDGDGFLGVAYGAGQVRGIRFSKSSATPLDAAPFLIAAEQGFDVPGVSFDGQSYLVVWESLKTVDFTSWDVRGARVSPAGVVLDPTSFVVSADNDDQRIPRVASNGKNSLVVWWDCRSDYYLGDIYGARVSQSGQVQDPDGIPIAKRASLQIDPNVAADGDDYLVVFLDTLRTGWGGGSEYDVFGTRVRGGVADPSPVEIRRKVPRMVPLVASARDGVSALVAWDELQGTGTGAPSVSTGAWMGRSPAFELLETTALAAAPSQIGSVLNVAPGRLAIFYSRFVEADGALRAKLRFADTGAKNASSCAAATDCQSRYCFDGVCCAEKCDGVCRRCGGVAGACEPVRSADDPDTCTGDRTCDADGECKKKNGSICAQPSECASGFCVDSFCCEAACSGACETCSEVRGSCTPRQRGTLGVPSCSPSRCDGKSRSCATECFADTDCADGFGCDRPSRTCIGGAVCTDSATTREVSGATKSCAPYACRSGACASSCAGVQDCAFPAVCNEEGRCVAAPPPSAPGCALSASHGRDPRAALAALAALCLGLATRRRRS